MGANEEYEGRAAAAAAWPRAGEDEVAARQSGESWRWQCKKGGAKEEGKKREATSMHQREEEEGGRG